MVKPPLFYSIFKPLILNATSVGIGTTTPTQARLQIAGSPNRTGSGLATGSYYEYVLKTPSDLAAGDYFLRSISSTGATVDVRFTVR